MDKFLSAMWASFIQYACFFSAKMAAAVRMDDLVKDYLLYRGLTSTFKSYDSELRNEKDKGFCVSIYQGTTF